MTAKLNDSQVTITRLNAAEAAAEVEHAREMERQMAKKAREKHSAEKTEAFMESVVLSDCGRSQFVVYFKMSWSIVTKKLR